MTDSARWKATVYVGGLAPVVTVANLHDAFIPFGEIADISLPKNENPSSTDPHRGFAYVEFEDAEDAKEAIDNMDQAELFGRVIKVNPAKAPKRADEGLGSKTAVWEQVSDTLSESFPPTTHINRILQEEWLAKHAVSEEDRMAAEGSPTAAKDVSADDPMQGLEGLDVAGPKPE